MQAEIVVLRLVHILGGIVWVGIGIFNSFFLLPAIADAGPSGGQVLGKLQKRHLFTFLPIVAILTMLSGLRLMQIVSGGFSAAYFASPMGRMYAISGGLAIAAFVIGMAVARPGAVKLAALSQSAVSDKTSKELIQSEIKALQSRVALSGKLAVALLVLSAAGMAIARSL